MPEYSSDGVAAHWQRRYGLFDGSWDPRRFELVAITCVLHVLASLDGSENCTAPSPDL